MIDTNEVRQSLMDRKGLIRHREIILALCDEIDRLRAGKQEPRGKTVRVKIAVAVDKTGDWNAIGGFGQEEKESMKDAMTDLEYGEVHYWLTADLPIPEETTVEAEVENANND